MSLLFKKKKISNKNVLIQVEKKKRQGLWTINDQGDTWN